MPAAPAGLPGTNHLASRQVMKWFQDGNSVSLPGGLHAGGFLLLGPTEELGNPREQPCLALFGLCSPDNISWPSSNLSQTLSPRLASQKRGRRENISICPGARFLLAHLRMVWTLPALQYRGQLPITCTLGYTSSDFQI